MTTKAELEQRLTDKQSEVIEWVLRHDAVEREARALREAIREAFATLFDRKDDDQVWSAMSRLIRALAPNPPTQAP